MDPERHRKLSRLFAEACELRGEARERFLREACADDAVLLERLRELLRQDARAEGIDATAELGAAIPEATATVTEAPGGTGRAVAPTPRVPGYRVVRELGSGGAGTVFEAVQETLNRRVALKLLSTRLTFSERAGKRFEREAWIAGKLNHPNIVKVFERGEYAGSSFISMEYVAGGSVEDLLERLRGEDADRALDLEYATRDYFDWVMRAIIGAARALDYTHRQGIVHRDIKPMNLLIDRESRTIKIADFGIAVDQSASRLTSEGQVLGTLRYMSPEQLQGKSDEIGPRSDVYSLGVTLYEMLTLRSPFPTESQEAFLRAVLAGEARSLAHHTTGVSRDLAVVVDTAIQRDPGDRYPSAGALADDLENVLQFRPIHARAPSLAGRLLRWMRRKPVHALLVATLLVGLPLTAILVVHNQRQQREIRATQIEELTRDLRRVRGDPGELRRIAGRLLELAPNSTAALRALVSASFNESWEATGDARDASIRSAQETVERLIAVDGSAWTHSLYAFLLRSWGRDEQADEQERLAAAKPQTDRDDYYRLLSAFERGDLSKEILEEAERVLSRILAEGESSSVLENRAFAHGQLGNFEQAIADYRVLVGLDPGDGWAFTQLGRMLTRATRFEEAERYLARARDLDATQWAGWENSSHNAIEWARESSSNSKPSALELFEDGAAFAREAIRLAPERSGPHLNLAASLIEQYRHSSDPDPDLLEQADRAAEASLRLANDEPARALAAIAQCDVLIEARKIDRAVAACERAVSLNPGDAVAHYNLAGAYAFIGRNDEALDMLARDHALGDNDHTYLADDPWFTELRDHPRFRDILASMRAADR